MNKRSSAAHSSDAFVRDVRARLNKDVSEAFAVHRNTVLKRQSETFAAQKRQRPGGEAQEPDGKRLCRRVRGQ